MVVNRIYDICKQYFKWEGCIYHVTADRKTGCWSVCRTPAWLCCTQCWWHGQLNGSGPEKPWADDPGLPLAPVLSIKRDFSTSFMGFSLSFFLSFLIRGRWHHEHEWTQLALSCHLHYHHWMQWDGQGWKPGYARGKASPGWSCCTYLVKPK